jgi:cyanate lyase
MVAKINSEMIKDWLDEKFEDGIVKSVNIEVTCKNIDGKLTETFSSNLLLTEDE